jgi:hypothetical protein
VAAQAEEPVCALSGKRSAGGLATEAFLLTVLDAGEILSRHLSSQRCSYLRSVLARQAWVLRMDHQDEATSRDDGLEVDSFRGDRR